LILIKQTCVVHLPGNRPQLAGCCILEVKHLNGLAPRRLSNSHASSSLGGVRQYLDPAPLVRVEVSLRHGGKLLSATVVHSRPVIPVSTVGDLKLNPTERIKRLLPGLRTIAKDEDTSLMVWIA